MGIPRKKGELSYTCFVENLRLSGGQGPGGGEMREDDPIRA